MKRVLICSALGMLLVTGCNTDLYYWGKYEDVIHYSYAHSSKWERSELIQLMEEDRERAKKTDKPLPPGWHAHLGMLYWDDNQPDRAAKEFGVEKDRFPESGVFMDRLLKRMATGELGAISNELLTEAGQASDGALATAGLTRP